MTDDVPYEERTSQRPDLGIADVAATLTPLAVPVAGLLGVDPVLLVTVVVGFWVAVGPV